MHRAQIYFEEDWNPESYLWGCDVEPRYDGLKDNKIMKEQKSAWNIYHTPCAMLKPAVQAHENLRQNNRVFQYYTYY